ncbi:conjugal transfer protein [Listeria monocytogenes]|nr:conjugal transfer protein [Listeria monocytogenes]EAD0385852.1 conjugal transfer protein [Listeria monocytogenes]EAD4839178.1 conjugal transfer protein [Listeria monocytogenes]EAF2023332.1 conjugal transfer protein [Listeria monocytogenes]EAH0493908.1 conjugal transfer protein [Listeria monocytogenes]
MEYDYTKIMQQKHRVYTIKGVPIPLVKNGITIQQMVVIGMVLIFFIILGIFIYIQGIDTLISVMKNAWLIIIITVGILIWTLFSLNWDRKSFLVYLLDRFRFKKNKYRQYEHGELVEFPLDYVVRYETERR